MSLERERVELLRVAEVAARDAGLPVVVEAAVAAMSTLLGGGPTCVIRITDDGPIPVGAARPGAAGTDVIVDDAIVGIVAAVADSGRAARHHATMGLAGAATTAEESVGVPIYIEGTLWGVLATGPAGSPLPPDSERLLVELAGVISAAVASARGRDGLRALADEQAALLRVAELVAEGASPAALFDTVAREASRLVENAPTTLCRVDGARAYTIVASHSGPAPAGTRIEIAPDDEGVVAEILRTRKAARIDDFRTRPGPAYARGDDFGVYSSVGVPILVDDRVWGVLGATSGGRRFVADTEERLQRFAGLMAAALDNVQARGNLQELVEEQAALRRVAQLSAGGGAPAAVFEAVATEVSTLLGGGLTVLTRIQDGSIGIVAASNDEILPAGTRYTILRGTVLAQVWDSGRPARVDDYSGLPGGQPALELGVRAAAGVPVRVDGQLWAVLSTSSATGPLPPDTELRLLQFAEIVSATVSAAQARGDLRRMADEQAALRRVAELVARAAPPPEVFTTVATEASRLLRGQAMTLARFDGQRELVVVASRGGPAPVGERIVFEPGTLPDRLQLRAAVVRVDDYTNEQDAELAAGFGLTACVAAPVMVAGDVWGMLAATSEARPLPPDTEHRLEPFAQLVTAALGNSQARIELQEMADEQSALRRVADLAARGASAESVLEAVAVEGSRLSGVDFTTLLRYEADGSTEIVALDGAPDGVVVGMRAPGTGEGAVQHLWRTGRAARVDDLTGVSGRWPQIASGAGFAASVAVPILIEGSLWGALVVVSRTEPLPRGIEDHLANFADLVGTAIAAAEGRLRLRALADEQAALRRVAELVARGAAPDEVFVAVTNEASALLGGLAAVLLRYEGEAAVAVATCNSPAPPGLRVPSHAGTPTGHVLRTGRPVRVDTFDGTPLADIARELGVASGVAVPITVEGRVRATLTTSSSGPPLRADTEARLTQFAELAAVAIANAETKTTLIASRARLVATADETRRRLQRDVHDGAQQRLVHTVIALKLARDAVEVGSAAAGPIREALANAERASSELRDVVHGILPQSLTLNGLRTGLESLVADLTLPVEVRVDTPRLSPATETTAYFVVAEALTNVVKHARARRASLRVELDRDTLVIEVRDDGIGGADPAHGTGLTGLLDRIDAAEGVLTLTSPAAGGTVVHAELPVGPGGGRKP